MSSHPLASTNSRTREPLSERRGCPSLYDLPRLKRGRQHLLQIGFEHRLGRSAFDRQARPHPPHAHALAKSVTFAPQLRGTQELVCPLSTARPGIQGRERGVGVPISSTKTKRSGLG